MVKHLLLNNIEHRELRVSTRQSPLYGDNINVGLLVPSEFRAAQHFYPIFLQKDSHTGKFFFSALFGFQEGENLFLDESGWNADYVPLSIMRQPFYIGQQMRIENGEQRVDRVIHIDIESPRVNAEGGERLFSETGESTPYLSMVADILEALHQGLIESNQLIDRLLAHNLLERFTLKVKFNEYKHYEMTDLYTINEDSLKALPDDIALAFYRDGTLENIYSVLHSQSCVSTLIKLKNKQDLM